MSNLNLLQLLKKMFDDVPQEGVETEIEAESETKVETKTQAESTSIETPQVNLTTYEEKLNNLYVGCFTADPNNPIVATQLGTVDNQAQCITMGATAGYDYAILQNGNICLGANNLNFKTMQSVPRTSCNSVCDETSAGFCGGAASNQIYATSLGVAQESARETFDNIDKSALTELENFASETRELQSIRQNLSQRDMLCEEPVNKYNLFLFVMIIVLLTYTIIEYIYKK